MSTRKKLKILIPREHGAWAVLFAPLLIGISVARGWSLTAFTLMAAVFFLYITRYPLVLWARSHFTKFPADGRPTVLFAAAHGLFLSALLLFKYHLPLLIPIAILAILLLLVHLWMVSRHKERTVAGEFLGICTLTLSAPAGFYVGSGNLTITALWLWLLCVLYFGASVFYVKMRVAGGGHNPALQREQSRYTRLVMMYQSVALIVVAVLSYLAALPALTLVAFLPMTVQLIVSLVRRSPLNLKRLGFTLVGQAIVFVVLVTIAFSSVSQI